MHSHRIWIAHVLIRAKRLKVTFGKGIEFNFEFTLHLDLSIFKFRVDNK